MTGTAKRRIPCGPIRAERGITANALITLCALTLLAVSPRTPSQGHGLCGHIHPAAALAFLLGLPFALPGLRSCTRPVAFSALLLNLSPLSAVDPAPDSDLASSALAAAALKPASGRSRGWPVRRGFFLNGRPRAGLISANSYENNPDFARAVLQRRELPAAEPALPIDLGAIRASASTPSSTTS